MSYGQWVIQEKETTEEFGYVVSGLTYGSRKPVVCVCSDCGVRANKRFREAKRKHICKSIIDGEKRCFKCNQRKELSEFSKNRSTFDGYQKCCKECFSNYDSVKRGYKKKSKLLKTDLEVYLRNKTSGLKRKSERMGLEFDLPKTFLYETLLKQNHKCYYTDIEIKHNEGCHQFDSISVERLDPMLGYTKDNVVLASYTINSFKGIMNELEFKLYLDLIIPKLIEYKNNN